MPILLQFKSVSDWSDPEKGVQFIQMLSSLGLEIAASGRFEPVRKPFRSTEIADHWKGEGMPGQSLTCDFLFKGSGQFGFSGDVVWERNLPVSARIFNRVSIWLKSKPLPPEDFLIELGDHLFEWSEAVHGFITDDSLFNPLGRSPEKRIYLPKLFWMNYFGKPYLEHPDFPKDWGTTRQVGGGVCVAVGDGPADKRLADLAYMGQLKADFGLGWFGEGPEEGYRSPEFDFSVIRREA